MLRTLCSSQHIHSTPEATSKAQPSTATSSQKRTHPTTPRRPQNLKLQSSGRRSSAHGSTEGTPQSADKTSSKAKGDNAETHSPINKQALRSESSSLPSPDLPQKRTPVSPDTPSVSGSSTRSHRRGSPGTIRRSNHTKILASWESDADRGSQATRGPVLYALETIPDKLAAVKGTDSL